MPGPLANGRGIEIRMGESVSAVSFGDAETTERRWRPLRRLRSDVSGVEIAVEFDDLDPYRGCGPLRPAGRVSDASLRGWQGTLESAWSLLVTDHRASAEAIAGGLMAVVPLEPSPDAAELSATCQEAIGAVAMTPPCDALALSLALVHEFQHTKLGALLDLVPMTDRQPERRLYSPWRRDPRPLHGLLQGAYAYLGLTGFWATQRTCELGPGIMCRLPGWTSSWPSHAVRWAGRSPRRWPRVA